MDPQLNLDVKLPAEVLRRVDALLAVGKGLGERLDVGVVALVESAYKTGLVHGFCLGVVCALVLFLIFGRAKQ